MSKKDFLDLLDTNTAEVLEKWGMDKETAEKLTKNTKSPKQMLEDAVNNPKVKELLKQALIVRCGFGTNKDESVLQFEMQFALNPKGFELLNYIFGEKQNDKKEKIAHA